MMTGTKLIKIWLAVSLVILLSAASRAGAIEPDDWLFLRLTDNAYNDRYPVISGSSVVWQGWVDGQDPEIFLYDGLVTTRLTDNADYEDEHDISGSNVVWWNDDKILMFDGAQVVQLADDGAYSVRVNGSHVVWDAYDGTDYEIYLHNLDSNETLQLTDNAYSEWAPHASESYVVWYGYDGGDFEIYLYDIEAGLTTQITTNSYEDRDAYVSDSHVVWLGRANNNYDVFLYEIETGLTTRLTDTMFDEGDCRVSGSNAVWYGMNSNWYFDIYLYKAASGELLNLSDSDYDDYGPEISGSSVVWYGYDGGDYEIFLYDIESDQLFQLSDNTNQDYDPDVSGRNVTWYTYEGSDYEVYFTGPYGDIDVSLLDYDFGQVDLGASDTTTLSVSNLQGAPITVSDIALQTDDGDAFAVSYDGALPIVLRAGRSVDVTITFTPTLAELASAALVIQSDDVDEASIEVQLSGTGVENVTDPAEKMEQILAFFDKAVEEGTLYGTGRHRRAAAMRLKTFRFMLLRADRLINRGYYWTASWHLRNACRFSDGKPWPMDLVAGEATGELTLLIEDLTADLKECESWPFYKHHRHMWWPWRYW
jgi:hypothetical protein